MRQVINLSLPAPLVKAVRREVKNGDYASTSEFFRHLLRLWNTKQLAEEIRRAREEFRTKKGTWKELRSLDDLD